MGHRLRLAETAGGACLCSERPASRPSGAGQAGLQVHRHALHMPQGLGHSLGAASGARHAQLGLVRRDGSDLAGCRAKGWAGKGQGCRLAQQQRHARAWQITAQQGARRRQADSWGLTTGAVRQARLAAGRFAAQHIKRAPLTPARPTCCATPAHGSSAGSRQKMQPRLDGFPVKMSDASLRAPPCQPCPGRAPPPAPLSPGSACAGH